MYLRQGLITYSGVVPGLVIQCQGYMYATPQRYRQLGTGNYDLHIEFLHLYPLDIMLIAKLESANGKVYQQQLMKK